MNRQQGQPVQSNQYYQTLANQYAEYGHPPPQSGYPQPDPNKPQDSDLIIFNGWQQQRKSYQTNQKQTLETQQQLNSLARSNSQKAYPIIYNSYNEYRTPTDNPRSSSKTPTTAKETLTNQYYHKQHAFQPSHSDVFLYGQANNHQQPQQTHFHSFKYIPPESQPQTAQFLQLPSDHSSDNSQHKLSIKKMGLAYQQEVNNFPMHMATRQQERNLVVNQGQHMVQGQQAVRTANRIFVGNLPPPSPSLSPRPNVQSSRQNIITVNQERGRFIQISQQQHQKYLQHMSSCRASQQEVSALRLKNQELSSKERFYWEENATLREENTRLRDIVTHFQKREKELLRERQQLRTSLLENINKYQQSTLEEMALLLERYRLQLQKKK